MHSRTWGADATTSVARRPGRRAIALSRWRRGSAGCDSVEEDSGLSLLDTRTRGSQKGHGKQGTRLREKAEFESVIGRLQIQQE